MNTGDTDDEENLLDPRAIQNVSETDEQSEIDEVDKKFKLRV